MVLSFYNTEEVADEKQGIYSAWPNHNYGNIRLTLHVLSTINVDDRPSEEVGHASRAPQ